MIAELSDIPKSIVHRIVLEDLAMRKVCAKMVPKIITDDMDTRVLRCKELLDRVETTLKLRYRTDGLLSVSKDPKHAEGEPVGLIEGAKAAATECLKVVTEDAFQAAFQDWVKRWKKCVEAGGE